MQNHRSLFSLSALFVAVALSGLLIAGPIAAAPRIGQPAPAFTGTDTAGTAWSLSELQGTAVVLEWTNHHCPYVIKHYGSGNMQRLQKEAADAGYLWLSVISSAPDKQGQVDAAEADELTESRGATPTAVLLDPEGSIGRAYGARTTPHLFIIDKQGILVYMGGIDDKPTSDPADIPDAQNYLRLAIADRAAGKPVQQPVSRPYGCSVKY